MLVDRDMSHLSTRAHKMHVCGRPVLEQSAKFMTFELRRYCRRAVSDLRCKLQKLCTWRIPVSIRVAPSVKVRGMIESTSIRYGCPSDGEIVACVHTELGCDAHKCGRALYVAVNNDD